MKLLSIAIPCYNSQDYMRHAIETLLAGGEDVEILVVNDGSKYKTADIAAEYQQKYPTIVHAINKENGPKFNPFFIPKMISDIAAGQISIRFGFHGPNYATTSACASSTNALADAFNSSIAVDGRMYRQDITGSMAHAAMLGAQDIIAQREAEQLIDGLQGILEDLDSGKLATAACSADARGISRVATVNCYPEDAPTEYCDKHVTVDYCVTGGGVATPFCSLFPDAVIETRSLVKLTQSEVDEIKAAMNSGLKSEYYQDGYVYLVDNDGNPIAWHGFRGTANVDADTPYVVCPIHNQQSYIDFGGQDNGNTDDGGNTGDNGSDNGGWSTDDGSDDDFIW